MGNNINSSFVLMLLAVSTQVTNGYVVKSITDQCLKEYFYMDRIPKYLKNNSDDVFICQEINGIKYFLTRYSKTYRIPIYSAYKIKSFHKIPDKKNYSWKTEKQLTEYDQATKHDYTPYTYDKGHLNPRYHNMYSVESINATFTLTNAVPKKHLSNVKWFHAAEKPLFEKMKEECNTPNAIRYVVTGVIPGSNWKNGRVNIPDYIWTAACCDTSKIVPKPHNSWSIGYLMNLTSNRNETCTVPQLRQKLMSLLPKTLVQLFYFTFLYTANHQRIRGCDFSDLQRVRQRN